jgi:hypothetical protein
VFASKCPSLASILRHGAPLLSLPRLEATSYPGYSLGVLLLTRCLLIRGRFVCIRIDVQGEVYDGFSDCECEELCAAAETQLSCDDRSGCCADYYELQDSTADDMGDALVAGHENLSYETDHHIGICGITAS